LITCFIASRPDSWKGRMFAFTPSGLQGGAGEAVVEQQRLEGPLVCRQL